jgi:hypothetical protein
MTIPFGSTTGPGLRYRIRFRGQISASWLPTLDHVTLSTNRHGRQIETTLTGLVPDEAGLVGIVNMVYDLGGALISVESWAAGSEVGAPGLQ